MQSEQTASTRSMNIDGCLDCVHFQALGCGGEIKFCTLLNMFLLHDPTAAYCSNRQPVEGSD